MHWVTSATGPPHLRIAGERAGITGTWLGGSPGNTPPTRVGLLPPDTAPPAGVSLQREDESREAKRSIKELKILWVIL